MRLTVKWSGAGVHDGEADAVDGDGALLDDVAGEVGGERDLDDLPVLGRLAFDDRARAVDVALHDVAAEAAAQGHGAFEVDAGADGEGAEAGAVEGLGHDVGGELVALVLDDRETDAVDGDRVAVPGAFGDDGAAEPEAGGVAEVLDGGDLAQFFDDSGEHFPGPPCLFGHGLRGLSMTTAVTGRNTGSDAGRSSTHGRAVRRRARMPARRALPPIRTLTVGPGIPPGQPAAEKCGRVADYNRRFGLSPTPECAASVTGQCATPGRTSMRVSCVDWLTRADGNKRQAQGGTFRPHDWSIPIDLHGPDLLASVPARRR